VALVMLRSFINDVIGKIAVLNQHLLRQRMATEVQTLYGSYQALFPILELQEWDSALQAIGELKKGIGMLESRPPETLADYPPTFAVLDPEIQTALRAEATPRPEAAVNLKVLTVDLDLKEKAVRQNTTEELLRIQKKCEEISGLIKDKNWQAAREALRPVEFPPELAENAKEKAVLIEKMLALAETAAKS